jgi:sugar phosphate isomerase/epimerase
MKLGIFEWFGFRLETREKFKLIKRAGFRSVMLWYDLHSPKRRLFRGKVKYVNDLGIQIENAHIPFNNANDWMSDDRKIRGRFLDGHREYFDRLGSSGIDSVVMHVSRGENIPGDYKNYLPVLRSLFEHARALKIKVCLENTRSAPLLEHVLNNAGLDNVFLCYDSSHDFLYSKKKYALLLKHGRSVRCLHLSDNNGKMDNHYLPFEGKIDWRAVTVNLRKTGYHGNISLEVVPSKNEKCTAEEFLAKAYARAREIGEAVRGGRSAIGPR